MNRFVPAAAALAFLAFFFLPIGFFYAAAGAGGREPGAFVQSLAEILRSPETWSVLSFTTLQAAVSAGVSVLIALPGAYLVARYRFAFKRFFLSLSLVPFVLPSIIVVICIISFYGTSGLVNRLFGTNYNLVYNFSGIVLAHVFYNFSLAVRVIGDGWRRIDRRYLEAARSLGDGPVRRFFRVTAPLLVPSGLTAFLLIFIYCFMSFGVVLVFGGVRYETLEVKIYREMYVRLDMTAAAAYSLLQLAVSAVFILLAGRSISGGGAPERKGALQTEETPIGAAPVLTRIAAALYGTAVLVFLAGPIVTMLVRSFTSDGAFSLSPYIELFAPGRGARSVGSILRSTVPGVIFRSLALAFVSGTVTFTAALATAFSLRGRRLLALESFFQLPIAVSVVTLGLGLRLLYGGLLPYTVLVVLGQALTAFPFVLRLAMTTVAGLRPAYLESARSLGAGPIRVFTEVSFPILRRGLMNAYAYSLAIPFADLTVVLSVSRGEIATFPVAIYRLIGFRSFDLALALSGIYIGICVLLFLWIELTTNGENR
jgi:thiamine transport system permease protein